MSTYKQRVEAALAELRAGKMIILTDDAARENEGDFIFPAEKITPESMNFMIRHGSGIVCLTLTAEKGKQLGLKFMVPAHENTAQRGTPFTVSIEAKKGVATGVSAADRVTTILAAMQPSASADDLCSPGHVFPLIANPEGVLARAGHTEGSVDLMRLAGLQPAAVLCEVMNPDGTMAQGETLTAFAAAHQLTILTMRDLVDYRLATESLVTDEVSATLPTDKYGTLQMTVVKEKISGREHVVLVKENKNNVLGTASAPMLVRVHSACMTGDIFGSARCDCQQQLHYGLQKISEEGGMLIYLAQEGRGIGLFDKIRAYALQEKGLDTVQANHELNLPVDARHYAIAASILRHRQITHVRLLTHNPAKINDLKKYGVMAVTREVMPVFAHAGNQDYLVTKKEKMMHLLDGIQQKHQTK